MPLSVPRLLPLPPNEEGSGLHLAGQLIGQGHWLRRLGFQLLELLAEVTEFGLDSVSCLVAIFDGHRRCCCSLCLLTIFPEGFADLGTLGTGAARLSRDRRRPQGGCQGSKLGWKACIVSNHGPPGWSEDGWA